MPAPTPAASDWQWASAPASPPRSPPLPKPVLVTKKRMLCGTFCAFCACAVQSPSIRSATEAKRDRVFTGDFMVHVSYVAINGATTECTPSCTCPLWVKSRHHGVSNQCPLYPQKRTLRQRKQMSAL